MARVVAVFCAWFAEKNSFYRKLLLIFTFPVWFGKTTSLVGADYFLRAPAFFQSQNLAAALGARPVDGVIPQGEFTIRVAVAAIENLAALRRAFHNLAGAAFFRAGHAGAYGFGIVAVRVA